MSGLVERVKEKVRSRSKSRRSSLHHEGPDNTDSSQGYSDHRSGMNSSPGNGSRMSSEVPAWHVSDGGRSSGHGHNKSLSQDNTRNSPISGEGAAERDSSRRQQNNYSSPSDGEYAANRTVIPPRNESLSTRKPLPITKNEPDSNNDRMTRTSLDTSGNSRLPGHQSGRSQDLAPQDPSPLIPRFTQVAVPTRDHNTSNGSELSPVTSTDGNQNSHSSLDSHIRVPAGFHLKDTQATHVDTTWRPAVTHETVHRQRTEIIQEAITRDIHVHHYYNYLQPIRVVEVLPARHFMLDEKTGIKTEIAAPAGWVMPENMTPRQPDTNQVAGWSRHYLVDEKNPLGVPEAPPLHNQEGRADLQHHNKSIGEAR